MSMTAVAKLPEKWLANAATCRADAERLGEGNPVHNELLRDAAQYEQCAHALQLALSPAELGGVEEEARRLFELNSANWPIVVPWDELHPQTRELWHQHALKRLSTPRAAEAVTDEVVKRLKANLWPMLENAKECHIAEALNAALTPPFAKGE